MPSDSDYSTDLDLLRLHLDDARAEVATLRTYNRTMDARNRVLLDELNAEKSHAAEATTNYEATYDALLDAEDAAVEVLNVRRGPGCAAATGLSILAWFGLALVAIGVSTALGPDYLLGYPAYATALLATGLVAVLTGYALGVATIER